ncbi:hypothetical protein N9B14_02705 [Akkermansiaceae bacterium]|nr:hypothetical protein [Akkermansiaceae bacterium]
MKLKKLRMPREQHLQPRGQFPRLCLKTKILGGNDLFITSNPKHSLGIFQATSWIGGYSLLLSGHPFPAIAHRDHPLQKESSRNRRQNTRSLKGSI